MSTILLPSRRTVVLGMAALPTALGISAPASSVSNNSEKSNQAGADGLTDTAEAIHQEIAFKAPPHAVYEALMNSQQFDAITRLSDGAALVTAADAKPTSISREVGGPFTLFGGYITGRNLELLRDERLVQSWRAGSWAAGDYSIVKFVLAANGAETSLVFDHRGFPEGEGKHLARGWYTHYWEPLSKYLARA
jgi:activator of HSP90 ATPase